MVFGNKGEDFSNIFYGAVSVGKSRMMTTFDGIQLVNNAVRQLRK